MPDPLDRAIAAVYAGPLEEFVQRRNDLVKALRAEKRRDEAQEVKALRKPTRIAWALNAAVAADPVTGDRVADAIAELLAAQAGEGDLREAMNELRESVQALAAAAASGAETVGHNVDQGTLANAVMAIIGTAEAFEHLRAARLADLPEAGGLDFLTSLPRVAPRRELRVEPGGETPEQAALREAIAQAESAAQAARTVANDALRTLRSAEVEAQDADRRLRLAQKEAHARQSDLDRARQESDRADREALQAERKLAEIRAGRPA